MRTGIRPLAEDAVNAIRVDPGMKWGGYRADRAILDEAQFDIGDLISEAVNKMVVAENQKLIDISEQVKQMGVGVTIQRCETKLEKDGDKWFLGSELKVTIDESVPPGEIRLVSYGHAGYTE